MPVSNTWISASSPRRRTPTRMRPLRVYLIALETRFWISRRNRLRSVCTVSEDGTIIRSSFFSAAMRLEIVADLAQQPVEAKNGIGRLHRAGIESRNVEHGAEDGLDRFQRRFDVQRRLAGGTLAGLLDQRGAVKPRRVERLQDVVSGGGKEARLAEIGLFGKHLRLRQFLVDLGQFGGALLNALLQRFIGSFQRQVGLDLRRYVGIGGDDAAVRHRVGAEFDRSGRWS